MEVRTDPLRAVPQPPTWASLLVAAGTTVAFALLLPFGLDRIPDVVLEGLYLLLALAMVVPIRRFGSGLVDLGWQLFVLGRLIDFLDEVFVEPEPLVEPYVSGFLMVLSLSVLVAGAYALFERRERQIDELSLKNDVIDEAPIGITVADMTRPDEPLVDVNDAFTRMTGYEAAETVGYNCRFLQGEETDQAKVDRMREAIQAGETVQVTLRNYRKDGTCFWNEITLAPIADGSGGVPYYAGFQQDATERKEYERRLENQRDDLDVLNQMLQHDIRNELQVVVANARLLAEHVTDEGERYLEDIDRAVGDAVELTDTARNLSETMLADDPDSRWVSLRKAVEREVDDLRDTFAGADVGVEVEGEIPDVVVEADDMLDSVFRNLLRNAVQHNDKERPAVTVSATRTDGRVVVRVADNGPGIPDERKDELFGRGEKGLESEGTGIGTYLVETLVTRYGGDVWIEDNDPEGAVFAVELPVAER